MKTQITNRTNQFSTTSFLFLALILSSIVFVEYNDENGNLTDEEKSQIGASSTNLQGILIGQIFHEDKPHFANNLAGLISLLFLIVLFESKISRITPSWIFFPAIITTAIGVLLKYPNILGSSAIFYSTTSFIASLLIFLIISQLTSTANYLKNLDFKSIKTHQLILTLVILLAVSTVTWLAYGGLFDQTTPPHSKTLHYLATIFGTLSAVTYFLLNSKRLQELVSELLRIRQG